MKSFGALETRIGSSHDDVGEPNDEIRLELMLMEAERLAVQMRSASREYNQPTRSTFNDRWKNTNETDFTSVNRIPESIDMQDNQTECSSIGIGHVLEQQTLRWTPSFAHPTIEEGNNSFHQHPDPKRYIGNSIVMEEYSEEERAVPDSREKKRIIEDLVTKSKSSVRIDNSVSYSNDVQGGHQNGREPRRNDRPNNSMKWNPNSNFNKFGDEDAMSCKNSAVTMFHDAKSINHEEKKCDDDSVISRKVDTYNEVEDTTLMSTNTFSYKVKNDVDAAIQTTQDIARALNEFGVSSEYIYGKSGLEEDFNYFPRTNSSTNVQSPALSKAWTSTTSPSRDDDDCVTVADYTCLKKPFVVLETDTSAPKTIDMTTNVKWEKISSAEAGDTDYVSIHDYSQSIAVRNILDSDFYDYGKLNFQSRRTILKRRRRNKRRKIKYFVATTFTVLMMMGLFIFMDDTRGKLILSHLVSKCEWSKIQSVFNGSYTSILDLMQEHSPPQTITITKSGTPFVPHNTNNSSICLAECNFFFEKDHNENIPTPIECFGIPSTSIDVQEIEESVEIYEYQSVCITLSETHIESKVVTPKFCTIPIASLFIPVCKTRGGTTFDAISYITIFNPDAPAFLV